MNENRTNMQRIFLMGAMIGELMENGVAEYDIRKGIEAAFIQARQLLENKS